MIETISKMILYSSAFLLSVGIKAAKLGSEFEKGLRLAKYFASKVLLSTAANKAEQYLNSPSSLRKRITGDSP